MAGRSREEICDVTLMINHPNEKLDAITEAFGLQPDYKWQVGQPRSTPIGTLLPGVNRDTYWAFSDRIAGHRHFFETAMELLAKLEAAEEFVRNLLAGDGRIRMVLHLPGRTNIGDTLAPADLLRMGRLGVALDVEVFPEMI